MKKQIAFGALLLCTGSSGAYYYAQREYGYDLGIFRTFYKYTYSLNPGLAVSITKALCFHNLLWKEQYVQGNMKLGIFDIKNPIGLASGFDECGVYIEALQNLGFGFIEIGSVAMHGSIKNNEDKNTYEPQPNNQIKYASELPQNGILKTKAAISTLRKSSQLNVPIGVSIMPSEDIYMYTPYLISSDLENSFRELCTIVDYVVINLTGSHRIQPQYSELVSSNSTVFPSIFRQLRKVQQEEIGLQAAIEHEFYNEPIEMKVSDVLNSQSITSKKELGTQLFVKITDGEDQSQLLQQLCQSAKSAEIDGIILAKHTVGNTQDYLNKLKYLQKSVPKGFPIISVGEIKNKNDVQERIANGATACQILSQFIIQGPSSVKGMLL